MILCNIILKIEKVHELFLESKTKESQLDQNAIPEPQRRSNHTMPNSYQTDTRSSITVRETKLEIQSNRKNSPDQTETTNIQCKFIFLFKKKRINIQPNARLKSEQRKKLYMNKT